MSRRRIDVTAAIPAALVLAMMTGFGTYYAVRGLPTSRPDTPKSVVKMLNPDRVNSVKWNVSYIVDKDEDLLTVMSCPTLGEAPAFYAVRDEKLAAAKDVGAYVPIAWAPDGEPFVLKPNWTYAGWAEVSEVEKETQQDE